MFILKHVMFKICPSIDLFDLLHLSIFFSALGKACYFFESRQLGVLLQVKDLSI